MKLPLRISVWGFCLVGISTLLSAGEPVTEWLNQPILGPTQTVVEVRAFADRRVPAMPKVNTAPEWSRMAERLRREMLERVVFRGEAVRWRDAKSRVEWLETIEGGPGYRIKKLRYEALPNFWIPALLYEPEQINGKTPVVLNLNGHEHEGKGVLNKQIRCINLAKRGMLALSPEWLGMGQLNPGDYRHSAMNYIDMCGTSGLAPFYLAMQRGLDVLLSLEQADRQRVAVAGLSGGGWQTIVLSALDPRVTLANPVAGYSSFHSRIENGADLGDAEQAPSDMATILDYTHLTAMLAPRPTLLTYNAKDNCCFRPDRTLPLLLEAAQPVFKLYGKAADLRTHINYDPGTHNFDRENREKFYQMLGDYFYPGDKGFSAVEIPSDGEVKTTNQLYVELPVGSANFHTLAVALSKNLPRQPEVPSGKAALKKWQVSQRKKLHSLVRAGEYTAQGTQVGGEQSGETKVTLWQLKLNSDWTVPVVEFSRGEPKGTTIIIGDNGRTNLTAEVETALAAGQRVLAVDLFYFGESKLGSIDLRYALLVRTVGERPLGIQASQLNAIAGWSRAQRAQETIKVIAVGSRNSFIALVAAGLAPAGIDALEFHGALGSLKEIVETRKNMDYNVELFCFGLLEAFDVKQLEALVSPRTIVKD